MLLIVKQNGLLLPSAKGGDLFWPKHLIVIHPADRGQNHGVTLLMA